MARALALAGRGLYTAHPNPRVGCVIVRGDEVVGEGFHLSPGKAHAEVLALEAAGGRARGATAYVTLEPCCHQGRTPPCIDALKAAGIDRVVAAMIDPNPKVAGRGLESLRQSGMQVSVGLLEAEAQALNKGFTKRMRTGRPWVTIKSALSLDGRSAMASGESRWITGEAAREDVQRQRAQRGAVLTGAGTIVADDPSLNVRLASEQLGVVMPAQPLRAVLDTRLRTSSDARWLGVDGEKIIFTADSDPQKAKDLTAAGAQLVRVAGAQGLDLGAVLDELGRREINDVLVEAGPRLNGAFLHAGLADEILLYLAPHLMGDAARGLATLPAIKVMRDRLPLRFTEITSVGEDLRITAVPAAHR